MHTFYKLEKYCSKDGFKIFKRERNNPNKVPLLLSLYCNFCIIKPFHCHRQLDYMNEYG